MKRAGGGALLAVLLTGCATMDVAAPAPTPPPARSIATAPPSELPPSELPPPELPPPSLTPSLPPLSEPPPVTAPPRTAPARPAPARPPVSAPPAAPARPVAPAPTLPLPSPPPAPSPPPPAPPQRVLSTGVDDEQRMRREAQTRIDSAERLLQDIDPKKLTEPRQEQDLLTIQSFLSKAKEALSARDVQRAFTLADKALVLADELSRTVSPR